MNIQRRLGEARAQLINTRAIIYLNQEQEKNQCGQVEALERMAFEEQQEIAAVKKATEDTAKKKVDDKAKTEPEEEPECASPS